jgi:hypothetical protein
MKPTKDFLKRARDDILKSGYPLELFCEEQLCKYPWVGGSTEYYPDQSGLHRRIDIEACLQAEWSWKKLRYSLSSDLWGECKKNTSSPWVFLEGGFPNEPNLISNIDNIDRHFDKRFFSRKSHDYCKIREMSKNYLVPFKKPESKESMQIYDAISNLCNYFCYRRNWAKKIDTPKQVSPFVRVVHLCVIFEGILLFGEIKQGNLHLKQVGRTCVYYSRWTGDGFLNCSIDVVTKEHFTDYVKSVERNHKFLASYLSRKLSSPRK